MKWNAYWRLMRFNKPVGILLLFFPTAWGLWFANAGMPPPGLFILFLLGTVIMRAAGCVVNDIADRNIDKHVLRTKNRPLTSGEVSLQEAFGVLLLLLCAALFILTQLNSNCFIWAVIALLITIIYPFCKRFINAPQLVLGFAFSMGIPMAYAASAVPIDKYCFTLLVINFAWIVAYDTMYAMTDKEDDLRIGVRSTAIYFASSDCLIIGLLQCLFHGLWLYLGILIHAHFSFYILWVLAAMVLIYQQILLKNKNPQECFKAFSISVYYGALMWLGLIVGLNINFW